MANKTNCDWSFNMLVKWSLSISQSKLKSVLDFTLKVKYLAT